MNNLFFIKLGNSVAGPFNATELKQMVAERQITPAGHLCRELDGKPDGKWRVAGQVKGLFPQDVQPTNTSPLPTKITLPSKYPVERQIASNHYDVAAIESAYIIYRRYAIYCAGGLFLTLVCFLWGYLSPFSFSFLGLPAGMNVLTLFFGTTSIVALCALFLHQSRLLYRLWNLLPEPYRRTSPDKAVGFTFIPYFNLYWVFIAYVGLTDDLNRYCQKHAIEIKPVGHGLAIVYCVVTVIICGLVGFVVFLPFFVIAHLVLGIILMGQCRNAAVAIIQHHDAN